jgi:hypothetical protein
MDLPVAPGTDLVLSLYLPEQTGLATYSHKPAPHAAAFADQAGNRRPADATGQVRRR